MKKSVVIGLCALSALAGAVTDRVAIRHAGSEPTPVRQDFKYPIVEKDFYLKKGEENRILYRTSSSIFTSPYEITVRYNGKLNERGDLVFYLQGAINPAQVGTPIELGIVKKTSQKIEITPLEIIAEGEDAEGILHLKFSAPDMK